jgi:hypothetical protein
MLLVGAGIVSSTDKKSSLKKNGLHCLIFSVFFIFLLGLSYMALFPILYKTIDTGNGTQDFANYIQVSPNPPTGSAPLRVFFDATSIDEANEDLFYEWDFGDDTEAGTGPKTSHSYKTTGIYNVKLTISNAEEREEIKKKFIDKKIKCVVATVVWQEGLNIPSLDVCVLAGSGKSDIKVVQGIGRGLRKTKDKDKVIIIDFDDSDVSKYLKNHFNKRMKTYKAMGWL